MSSRRSNKGQQRAAIVNRRKLGGLAVLGAICAVVWGRNVWLDQPRKAGAAAIDLGGGTIGDVRTDERAAAPRPSVRVALGAAAERDPFVLDVGAYEQRPVLDVPEPEPEPRTLAATSQPDDSGREFQALRLQGTFLGDVPRAMINNRTLRIGEMIRGFRLESVGNRRVTLVKGDVQFDLEM